MGIVVYALTLTIAAGLVLLGVPALLYAALRRTKEGGLSLGSWSWRPNTLGFTIIAIVLAVALWRFFPGFLFLPFIIPFFWRMRGGGRGGGGGGGDGGRHPRPGGPFVWQWRVRRDPPSTGNGHSNGHGKPDERRRIEGQYHNLDDE